MTNMTLQEIETKIEEIEARGDRQYKQMKQIIERIGEHMNTNDFNFDSLLDEIDEEETAQEAQEPTVSDLDALLDAPQTDVMTSTTDEETVQDVVVQEKQPEIDLESLADTSKDDEIQDYKKLIEAQNAKIAELEKTQAPVSVSTNEVIKEYGDEIKSFAKEMLDVDIRKKALQEEVKTIKADYDERGVDVPYAIKAMKEIQREMKETTEEAAGVQATKDFLRKDESIIKTLDALNQ